jgi:hypothetical protein
MQLLGHAVFEDLKAHPRIFHGFVAAPVLEHFSLMLKIGGFGDDLCGHVANKVREMREDALTKKQCLHKGSSERD